MNILFVSRDLSGGDLAYRLKNEGNNVKLFIKDYDLKKCFDGMVEKTDNWEDDIEWAGKEGLIVFDSTGYGKIQDDLRRKGYSVVGGCELGDNLEHDRQYGQKIFSACGIDIVPTESFDSLEGAIAFVKNNKGPWVVKQNGHQDKTCNYVGEFEDGRDVIDVLESYLKNKEKCIPVDLQKRIYGIEIGVARYFNGNDWVGPIEINIEHKDLFAGGIGPKTDEMGTLMWYEKNEDNKLFQATLAKLKPYLQEIDFRGDIDINCIVNEGKVFPLELTTRFGWPAIHAQESLHISSWGEFLKAVADGKKYRLKYKEGFAMTVLIAVPPFPYKIDNEKYSFRDKTIYFSSELTEDESAGIHFDEVFRDGEGVFRIAGDSGFVLNVVCVGKTVKMARENIHKIIKKIIIPKKFYRNDIGVKFEREDSEKLKRWGWIV